MSIPYPLRTAFYVVCLLALGTLVLSGGAEHARAETATDAAHDGHAGGHGHADLGHGNATSGLADAAQFRTDLAIYTFVVFMLLLAILSRVAWPVISKALVEREKRIESAIAAADAKHEQAKALLAAHEARLAKASDEVRELLDEARRDAEGTRDQIVADARTAADQERQRALRDIKIASDSAIKNLAETSATLAVQLAGKVIGEHMQSNPGKQAELVRSALAQLTSAGPSKN